MTIRFWRFGEFASQHAAIHFQDLGFGRSIVVEGSNTDQEQSTFEVDSAGHQWAVHVNVATDHTYGAVNVGLALLKAKLGRVPILQKVEFRPINRDLATVNYDVRISRFINPPTVGDASTRYRDRTGLITWYEDVYAPYVGQDVENPPALNLLGQSLATKVRARWNVTSIVRRALRDNTDVDFLVRIANQGAGYFNTNNSTVGEWPYFEFLFFYPVEFYQTDALGNVDLLSPVDDTPGSEYYLGAVERGQTGTPVKCVFRNMTGETQQIELFDDHPESEDPVQRVGTGTGNLDYVELADNAVSQLYTAVFYSSSNYELRAVADREYPTDLHPTINADASWRGTVGADKTFPTPSGLTIRAEFWQPGTLTGDEIEIAVRGDTTNIDWPFDSNDQVEMTFDIANAPDAANWRPITGHRVKTSAAVTVDATTKLFPTRFVDPAHWPIGNRAFVHNLTDHDAGTVKAVQEADIGTPAHAGTGTDDLTVSGNHNGPITDNYVVEIDAGGTPGTFKWSNDNGGSFVETGVVPTGSPQLLENGIYVTIPTGTNHVLADTWTIAVKAWALELENLTSGSTIYGTNSIVGTTLPFRDVAGAIFGQVNADSGASETPDSRLYMESTAGFTAGNELLVEQAGENGNSELATIATLGVQTTYLDLTASLNLDYSHGDFVTKTTAGNNAFWKRIVSGPTTVEQLKSYRLNARIL